MSGTVGAQPGTPTLAYAHAADGIEHAFRVWSKLVGVEEWILASSAFSQRAHADKYCAFLAVKVDRGFEAHEVREECPKVGWMVVDDVDALMRDAEIEGWA